LFKRSLEANPRSRYAHLAWAMWERQQGNAAASLQLLARGSSLNPADAALYQARGIVEKEAGRVDQARAVFRQGLAVDGAHLYLWQAWGVMEFQLGRYDEARRLFQEGVWADPGNKDVVFIFQVGCYFVMLLCYNMCYATFVYSQVGLMGCTNVVTRRW
jgi:tetratricopeptide (TPR) repeat protein